MSNMQKNRVQIYFSKNENDNRDFDRANNPNSKTRAKRIKEEEILTKKYKEKQCNKY